nr:MAG TPA: hypothetical protein [Caudoviricetes sp.]
MTAAVSVVRDWDAEWAQIVSGSIGEEKGVTDGGWDSDGRGSGMAAGGAPARRTAPRAPGSLRVDSPLRRFLLEALDQNSPEKVIAAVRAMRSAGFGGEVMAEVRPYLGWEGEEASD